MHPQENSNFQNFRNALLGVLVEFYCIKIGAVNILNGSY